MVSPSIAIHQEERHAERVVAHEVHARVRDACFACRFEDAVLDCARHDVRAFARVGAGHQGERLGTPSECSTTASNDHVWREAPPVRAAGCRCGRSVRCGSAGGTAA